MALALRRPRRADLLAHREEIDGRPLPADQLRRLRGRRDDRGRRAARHHDGARGQLRRLARPNRDRVRDRAPARLRSPPEDQTDQQGQALPARPREPRRLPPAQTGDDPPDPLGTHRAELRPDDQVRDGNHGRHRVHRSDPAALHPQRLTPRLPSYARARPRAEDDLHRALPPRSRPATRDRRGPEPDRVVEPRQRRDLLRQERRVRDQPPRATGARDALPAHPPSRARLRQHPDDPRHPRRTRMGRVLTPEDLRGLTPLFWAHVLPYGEVKLNMTRRLALNAAQTVETNAESS